MKTNTISQNYTPTFRSPVVPYPEFINSYSVSQTNANKADALTSYPVTALANKLAKSFRMLFTPQITVRANDIKQGIDKVFEETQVVGKTLDKVA